MVLLVDYFLNYCELVGLYNVREIDTVLLNAPVSSRSCNKCGCTFRL